MEISEKLKRYKIHIVSLGLCVVVSTLELVVDSRFVTILSYFWPLLLSTALFLAAVVVFVKTTTVSTDVTGDKADEGLLDYVAGKPNHHLHHHQSNHHDVHDLHEDEHKVETSTSQ